MNENNRMKDRNSKIVKAVKTQRKRIGHIQIKKKQGKYSHKVEEAM